MLVYFSFYFMHYEILSSMLLGCVSCMCGIGFTLIGLCVICRCYVIRFFKKNYMYFFIVLTFFTIAMGVSFYSLDRYNKLTSLYDVNITAHVTNVANTDNGYKVELNNVCVDSSKISEHIIMYVYGNIDIAIGNDVSFTGDMKVASLYSDTLNVYSFVNNTPYTVYKYESLVVTKGTKSVSETVRSFVKEKLVANLDALNASIVYATMFGEKTEIPSDVYSMFSLSGVSHILAVSGLHIGIFVAMLSFILSKLKVDNKKTFVITLIVVMFYASLCDFTASVVRAGIMSLVLLFSKIVFRKYDTISALSFAGLLYMLISPLSIFTVGFQLSYLCVFAIITLAPYINKMFCYIKLPKAIASTLSISIAVNLVIFPVAANVFDSVSMVGIVSNMVVLPIFNVVYIMSLAVTILSLIPIFNIFYVLVNVGVGLLLYIIKLFSYIDILNFTVFHISYVAMFLIVFMLLVLKFALVKNYIKAIAIGLAFVTISCFIVGGVMPTRYHGINVMVDYQYNSNVAIYTVNNKNVLIGANIKEKQLNKILKNRKINTIDYVVAFDINKDNCNMLYNLSKYNVSKIYVYSDTLGDLDLPIEVKDTTDTILMENAMSIKVIDRAYKILALDIYVHGNSILHLNSSLQKVEYQYIANNITKDYDYTLALNFKYNLTDYTDISFGNIVAHGKVEDAYNNVINMENCYFYEINIKNGI
ncbi:MAG: ComEC/Rec2 family competence protein [Clostridia bacterium]|nr:ComEC/Rec2 family competence protein [Clostridia bacterium]